MVEGRRDVPDVIGRDFTGGGSVESWCMFCGAGASSNNGSSGKVLFVDLGKEVEA